MSKDNIVALRLGRLEYGSAWRLQQQLVAARRSDNIPDIILLMEHPPVITFGQDGGAESLLLSPEGLVEKGVAIYHVERGGKGTFHGPGQVVLYPIIKWPASNILGLVEALEQGVINTLYYYNIGGGRDPQYPGIWYGKDKIAALGLAYRDGVTSHGIGLNVSTELSYFNLFTPCGLVDRGVTSMERVLGGRLQPETVALTLVREVAKALGRELTWGFQDAPWLKASAPPYEELSGVWNIIKEERLETVCDSAHCPNLGECFASGTATFMILGDRCTRKCGYCAVPAGRPLPPDPGEPERLARAAKRLNLDYVVITSVCRDDLPDGGASHFASCISAIRQELPSAKVEVLVPDFSGSQHALEKIISARPDVFNHNIETVPRLFPKVRSKADYYQSLRILRYASLQGLSTKSGVMLGLGEYRGEVMEVLRELRQAYCEIVTIGQYLAPGQNNVPVTEFINPQEFLWYRNEGMRMGFKAVESNPLVRSSYHAKDTCNKAISLC